MYCVYPWECVSGGARVCVCSYVFTLWHKGTEGAQLGRASVYSMRTWEHLGLILYICILAQRSQTHVHHCAADGCRNSFVSFDSWAPFIFSLFRFHNPVWAPPFCTGLSRNGEWKGQEAVSDLAEAATELNFHGGASEKCCFSLIDDENHWIQRFRWGLWYKISEDGLSEKPTQSFVPIHSLLYFTYIYGAWRFGEEPPQRQTQRRADGRRKGRFKRKRRDEGKDSWYLNHAGWLFCAAQVYLKRSSICSAPLCFQALWGNAHSLWHIQLQAPSPLQLHLWVLCNVMILVLHFDETSSQQEWSHTLHRRIGRKLWPRCSCVCVAVTAHQEAPTLSSAARASALISWRR